MRRFLPAGTTVVLGLLLMAALMLGLPAVVTVLLVAVVMVASGWPTLMGLPTPRGSTTVLSLCGAVAVLAQLLAWDRVDRPLDWLAPVLACSIVGAFMHQLLRRDMRPRLIDSVTGVVAGVVLVESAAGWVAVAQVRPGVALVGAGALVAAASGLALPGPRAVPVVASVVLACTAAAALAATLDLPVAPAAGLGLLLAGVAALLWHLFTTLPSATSVQAGLASAATCLCACGMIVFLVSELGAAVLA